MAIQFTLDGLSYALLDSKTKTLVALESFESDYFSSINDFFHTLEQALELKGLNDKDFQSVTCLFGNRYSTLVPETIFSESDQAKYIDFSFQIPENYAIGAERIAKAGCINVHAFPKALKDKLLNKWKNTQFSHTSTIFIDEAMNRRQETEININVRNHDFDMAICKNGRLHFFNNFKFVTKEDFAYFLLFAMEQNGLSGQDTPIRFSGLIRPATDIIGLCSRYIRDIHFVEIPRALQISEALKEVPFQYYHIHYQALR